MKNRPLMINAVRESYGKEDIQTMTVGELMAYLEQYDEDRPIVFSHDYGYTYGGIREDLFIYDEDDTDDDEEESQ